MKKLRFLSIIYSVLTTICAFSSTIEKCAYFEANPQLGGDVKILKSTRFVIDGESFAQFDVEALESGKYFISFWMLPPQKTDGSFYSYRLMVNGTEQLAKITPTKGGWQFISLDGLSKVNLSIGKNTISIIGHIPDVPMVEHVRLSKLPTQFSETLSDYESYILDIKGGSDNELNALSVGNESVGDIVDVPVSDATYVPFDYECSESMPIKYTYHGLFYFVAGENVSIKSEAKDNFAHKINIYSWDAPDSYSWYGGTNANLSFVAPVTGFYGIVARSAQVGGEGFCSILINGTHKIADVPVSLSRLIVSQSTDQKYNSFTTNSNVDPILWVEESLQGKVIAMNDDYQGDGDFDWKWDSRINTIYPRRAKTVVVAAANSYTPIGQTDIYARVKNKSFSKITFPLLNDNDCMLSAPEGDYNCIGWSGGLLCVRWPEYEGCDENWLDWYDTFYGSERYPGSPLYTRQGANADNSMIDLWGVKNPINQPDQNYTHASIRKGGNDYPHGYDWESKTGEINPRVFHPRYAIGGSRTYGEVLEHYRLIPDNNTYRTLVESIADGDAVVETIAFNEAEVALIQSKLNDIKESLLAEFERLYSVWSGIYKELENSNPSSFDNIGEYKSLLSFCQQNDMRYAIYNKIKNNENCAMKLIVDLDYANNQSVLQRVKGYNRNHKYDGSGAMIVESSMSFVKRFVKYLLSGEVSQDNLTVGELENSTYSNQDDVRVKANIESFTT